MAKAPRDADLNVSSDVLRDVGCALQVRGRLDHLALAVLTSPGMGGPAVGELREFLDTDWPGGVAAAGRVESFATTGEVAQ